MPHLKAHSANSVLFGCIDDRLSDADTTFIHSLHGGAFHPSMAGGGGAFLNEQDRDSAVKQITAAYQINHITDVYLESHTDCGAYRLAGIEFKDRTEELKRLRADLKQAATQVQAALNRAGAKAGEVAIHTRVITPTGQLLAAS